MKKIMMNISLINKKTARLFVPVFLTAAFCAFLTAPVHAGENEENKKSFYSLDVDSLAKDIFVSCELFHEGKTLYENSDYDNAQAKFREALAIDPGNEKASKYLKLCVAAKTPGAAPGSRVGASLSKKPVSEDKNNEADIQLLQRLIARVDNIEESKKTQSSRPRAAGPSGDEQKQDITPAVSKKSSARFKERARLVKPKQYTNEKKKLEATTLQEIEKAEALLAEGDKYYENLNYEKAYKLYKTALEVLYPETDSSN